MDQKLKKALSILVIVLSVAAVICIAFGNQELHDAWDAVRRLDLLYILGLLGCWAVYAGGDGVGIWFCLRRQGFLLSAGAIVRITLCGFFYSNITPGASGGQPMQVAAMNKAGVPVGNGTAFRRAWIRKLVNSLISLLAKIRILKDPETTRRSADEVLDTYHTALNSLLRSPGEIIRQCLCSTASLLALTGSIVFVYHAFGMSGTPWYHLMSLAFVLFVSASYTPLPGASGAQEGGFLFYFRGIFTGGTIGLALLTWRFFTYYLFIFVGVINLLAEKISRRRQKR